MVIVKCVVLTSARGRYTTMSTRYEDVKVTFVRVGAATNLGVQLSRGVGGSGPLVVSAAVDGSVAAQSKRVQRGDILVAINGVSTSCINLQRANGMLEVPAVCLTLMRARLRRWRQGLARHRQGLPLRRNSQGEASVGDTDGERPVCLGGAVT